MNSIKFYFIKINIKNETINFYYMQVLLLLSNIIIYNNNFYK